MKFASLLALIAALTASCASTPLIGSLSPQAGERAAHRDIASGHMRILIAGTQFSSEVGVEAQDRPLVRKLPRDRSLPIGCTVPHASEAIGYAEAYNRQIIRHLRGYPNT